MRIETQGLAETIERMRARQERVERLQPALEFFGEDLVKQTDDCFQKSADWDGEAFAPLKPSTIEERARRHASRGTYRARRSALRTKLKGQGKSGRQVAQTLQRDRAAYLTKRRRFVHGLNRGEKRAALKRAREAYERKNAKIKASGKSATEQAALRAANRKAFKRKKDQIGSPASVKILVDTARARNSSHVDRPTATAVQWSAVGYLAFHMAGTVKMEARNPTAFVWDGSSWSLHERAAESFDRAVQNYIIRGAPDADAAGAA